MSLFNPDKNVAAQGQSAPGVCKQRTARRRCLSALLLLLLGIGPSGCGVGAGAGHAPPAFGELEYEGMVFGGDSSAQDLHSVHLYVLHEANRNRYLVLPSGKRICCYRLTVDDLLREMEVPDEEAQEIREKAEAHRVAFIGDTENNSITYSRKFASSEPESVGIFAYQDKHNARIYGISPSEDGPVLKIRCTREEVEAVFGKPTKFNFRSNC